MRDDSAGSRTDRRIGAWLPVGATFAVTALLLVATVGMGRIQVVPPDWQVGRLDRTPQMPTQQPWQEDAALPDETTTGSPSGLDIPWQVPLIVLLTAVVVVAVILLRRLAGRFSGRGSSAVVGGTFDLPPDQAEELRKAAQSAGEALGDRTGGGDAVIAAWLALETAAAESGVARAPWQTPTEFTAHLLRRHHADDEATERLRSLYHRARFAADPRITGDDVEAAREAVGTIVRTLDAP